MTQNEYNHMDRLSVYGDYYSLADEQCMALIRQRIAANTPLTDEEYRIIAVEQRRGLSLKKLRLGKYATHIILDPGGLFTNQAYFNSIPGSISIPTRPTFDHMAPESREIMERISRMSPFPVFKSAFHPDFDVHQ